MKPCQRIIKIISKIIAQRSWGILDTDARHSNIDPVARCTTVAVDEEQEKRPKKTPSVPLTLVHKGQKQEKLDNTSPDVVISFLKVTMIQEQKQMEPDAEKVRLERQGKTLRHEEDRPRREE